MPKLITDAKYLVEVTIMDTEVHEDGYPKKVAKFMHDIGGMRNLDQLMLGVEVNKAIERYENES